MPHDFAVSFRRSEQTSPNKQALKRFLPTLGRLRPSRSPSPNYFARRNPAVVTKKKGGFGFFVSVPLHHGAPAGWRVIAVHRLRRDGGVVSEGGHDAGAAEVYRSGIVCDKPLVAVGVYRKTHHWTNC